LLTWLKQRGDQRRTARALYGSIVTQARQPDFYASWGVPDTAEGRFEVLAMHLVLVLHRLESSAVDPRVPRLLNEIFVVDLDDALRELAVGDLAVPRQVKRAVAVLHDRHVLYGGALDDGEDRRLADAISARLGTLKDARDLDTAAICAYLRGAARSIDQADDTALIAGRLPWPRPGETRHSPRPAMG
jgi:cytochrome b pre-mRNA-processing protein 3